MKPLRRLGALILLARIAPAYGAVEAPKLSFGGQIRARAESTSIQSYASAGTRRAQDLYLLRSRLQVAIDYPPQKVKGFLQLQDSRTAGSEASVASNEKNVDLHQGYLDALELFGMPLDLRAGRWEMSYGDQRLISPLDWSNVARAWDGLRLKWRGEDWWSDAFATNVKEVSRVQSDSHFWGLYGHAKRLGGHELEAYLLGRDNGDNSYLSEAGTLGNLSDRTLGSRVKGRHGGLDYTAEGAWQFGRKAGQRVRAWATAATAGYTFDSAWTPRAGLEHTFGSGDSRPDDNKVGAFDPLFTFGHYYYGYQDVFNWRNGQDLALRLQADPAPPWRLLADLHRFWLHEKSDAWYDAAGAQITRDASARSGRDIGTELDLHVRGKFREVIDLWFGYSRFFAGAFVRKATGRGDRDWAFFQATFNF